MKNRLRVYDGGIDSHIPRLDNMMFETEDMEGHEEISNSLTEEDDIKKHIQWTNWIGRSSLYDV